MEIPPNDPTSEQDVLDPGRPRRSDRHKSRSRSKATQPKRKRPLLVGIAVAVLVLVLASAGYAYWRYYTITSRMAPTAQEQKELAATLDPVKPSDPTTTAKEPLYILLMGDDRRSGETRARSDTLMLARVDQNTKKVILLSIPRDTRVPIEGHATQKINAAYAFGGPALAVKTVKQFTGLPVNHYMQIDFQGLTQVVDAMGGLYVNVDRTINDNYRKIDNKSSGASTADVYHIDKGYQKLNGAQALTYVRSRAFPEGDFVRVQHQRTFLMALAKQALTSKMAPRMPGILDSVSQHLKTDMSPSDLLALASAMKGMGSGAVTGRTVPGKGEMIKGGWYLIPNEAKTKELLDYFSRGELPPGPEEKSFD